MTKFWQVTQTIGVFVLSIGVMDVAHAYGSSTPNSRSNDCSNHTPSNPSNPNCYTWTFDSSSTVVNGVKVGGTPGLTATPTGYSNSGGSGNTLLESAYVGSYSSSGIGVTNNDESSSGGNHAVDNSGRIDSVLFTFSDKVNLTSFNAGWVQTDSDFTVLAFTGTGGPTGLAGKTYAELLTNGWSLIGNYAGTSATGAHNFADYNNGTSTGENTTFSSYWLIGALNPLVGGPSGGDVGNDFFKILSVAGCDCSKTPNAEGCSGGTPPGGGVPEPGTLLLMGAGLFGLTRFSARRADRSTV